MSYLGHSLEESYPSVEMQSVYSIAPAHSAMHRVNVKSVLYFFRIHKAKMKCMDERGRMLRTGLLSDDTKEVHGQDSHHGVQFLIAIDQTTPCRVNYKQIKRPSAKCKSEWIQFDEGISEIIRTTWKGNADRRLNILITIIVSYAKERSGLRESKKEKKTTVRTVEQRRCRT